jgi:uncharacterized DUF497 family protein
MRFVWDEEKCKCNLAKHKVSFERATLVFEDPHHLSIPDDYETEERWLTMGLVNGLVVILVVHTIEEQDHEEVIRIVSARKARRREKKAYDQNYGGG